MSLIPRVLVVDDDHNYLAMMEAILAHQQMETVCVNGVEEAVQRLERQSYDALLLDLAMPLRDGFELIGILESRWPSMLPRTIIVTGLVPQKIASLDGKACRIIRKPFDIYEAVAAIRSCLQQADQISGVEQAPGRSDNA